MSHEAPQRVLPGLEPVISPVLVATIRRPVFAGLTWSQLVFGAIAVFAAIWAMWMTREMLVVRAHKVVSVRLATLVNDFAMTEARSGDPEDKAAARTKAFMAALDASLKKRSDAGAVVLVGEAVISSSVEDITAAVAADVRAAVPMPIALVMPPSVPTQGPIQTSGPASLSGPLIINTRLPPAAAQSSADPNSGSPFGTAPGPEDVSQVGGSDGQQ